MAVVEHDQGKALRIQVKKIYFRLDLPNDADTLLELVEIKSE